MNEKQLISKAMSLLGRRITPKRRAANAARARLPRLGKANYHIRNQKRSKANQGLCGYRGNTLVICFGDDIESAQKWERDMKAEQASHIAARNDKP